MKVGIVGSERAKFDDRTMWDAMGLITDLINRPEVTTVVSGGCHLGGIDIWAENVGELYQKKVVVHTPASRTWAAGYQARNLKIAEDSDEVHCITVAELPAAYKGMTFPLCYHCVKEGPGFADVPHVKSGGCWTMHKARKMGKKGFLHVIK